MVKAVSGGLYAMKALIDIGNPDAPKGSEPWCRSFHQTICRLKREGQFAVSNLKYSLRDFHDGKHFARLTDPEGSPFKTWDSFVQCREPYGLGMKPEVARAIMTEQDDSRLLRDVLGQREIGIEGGKAGPGRGKKTTDSVSRFSHGNSRAYILARLDRDGHASLAAKVRAGTMSANAAAITAGFRKASTPLDQILKLLPKLTPKELRYLQKCIWQEAAE